MPQPFTREEKKKMFLDLTTYSYRDLVSKYDLLKRYQDVKCAVGALVQMKRGMVKHPELYDILPEELALVEKSLKARSTAQPLSVMAQPTQEVFAIQELEQMEVKDLVQRGTKGGWVLLNKKIDQLLRSKRQIAKTPLNVIAMTAGVLFDKNQISKGEATERIFMTARIGKEMTPEEKMDWLLKLREKIAQGE